MKLRPPSVPLITVDPYFSIWSPSETLNFKPTVHWTGAEQALLGLVTVDGVTETFLGYCRNAKKMRQVAMDVDALSTQATFENDSIRLFVRFLTPVLLEDLELLSRPVSYIAVSYEKKHASVGDVQIALLASEGLCQDRAHEAPVVLQQATCGTASVAKVGRREQTPLNRSGDNLRIDWGYFCLGTVGGRVLAELSAGPLRNCKLQENVRCELAEHEARIAALPAYTETALRAEISPAAGETALFLLAYDDLGVSINYFCQTLTSYWNRDGKTIDTAMAEAAEQYTALVERCDAFSDRLCADAYMAGGEKYADLLALAYRQVIAAHKLVVDGNGDLLYISKECFSNGCAATVDVSYPSIPLFLQYAPQLIHAMLRPIYRFAADPRWKYDYAPHDAGRYPLVTGQVYSLDRKTGELLHAGQMPVEECGNMIIMEANAALAMGNASFAREHIDTLHAWVKYLIRYGDDPENQLCTDDFAGHLAHNCNLSLKAIIGIEGMAILSDMLGDAAARDTYHALAREKADSWCRRAKNPDGSYRLAFDQEGSWSMKYNMIWDKLWGTGLFPEEVYAEELASNFDHITTYGMPLDSRIPFTKSDWLVWCATMLATRADFKRFIAPLWKFYNETPDRVPMSDWYDADSGTHIEFIHRSVQGGLYIKLLADTGKLRYRHS